MTSFCILNKMWKRFQVSLFLTNRLSLEHYTPGTIYRYENGMRKVARNAFNIGEVWNPVSCHGNKTVTLVLWSTFSRIFLQKVIFLIQIGRDISFYHIWSKIWLTVWRNHLANLRILKTWISLERKKKYLRTVYSTLLPIQTTYLHFKMASIGKMRFSSKMSKF